MLEAGLVLQAVQQVGHAQGHVARLVACGQAADLACEGVGRLGLQELQQVHEGAFAQHRQQKARHGKIRLVQQALERGLATRRGQRGLAAVAADAAREDIDMSRLVGHLDGQRRLQLAVVRVQLAQEARRHQQGRVLVLHHVGHELDDGVLHRRGQLGRIAPVDVGVGIPLRGHGLGVEVGGAVGPDLQLVAEPEMEGRRPGFHLRATRGQAPERLGLRGHGIASRARIAAARLRRAAPAPGLGAAARHDGHGLCSTRAVLPAQAVALVAAPARQLGLPARRAAGHAQLPAHGQGGQRVLDQKMGTGIEAQALQVDDRQGGGGLGGGGQGAAVGIRHGHGAYQ